MRASTLVVLAMCAAVAPLATDLYLPGFPAMRADLGVSASAVQLTLTAFLVGSALGQLVMGPLSDRFGRRSPLLVSTAVCALAGAVCAQAPTIGVLVAARLVQGLAGAGGMVIGRAVITDLVTGRAAARALTLMVTVMGVAPMLAPLAGGLLSGPVGWRGMLWTVAALCAAMFVAVLAGLRETHPRQRRAERPSVLTAYRTVVTSRAFWVPTAGVGLAFSVVMAYISASPFVYQNVVGLSAVGYGIVFGITAVGLMATGFLSSRLVERVGPVRIVGTALTVQLLAALVLVVLTTSHAPTWLLPVLIFVAVSTNAAVIGNCAAIAMSQVREVAGTGSAVVGCVQFGAGGLVAPLVGMGGEHTAVVPAVVMAIASVLGFGLSRLGLGQSRASSTVTATP